MNIIEFVHTMQQKPVRQRRYIFVATVACCMIVVIAGWIIAKKMITRTEQYETTASDINKTPFEIIQNGLSELMQKF